MDVMPTVMVKAGDIVFSEGQAPDKGMYFICYGTVEVKRNEPDGERVLAELSDGMVFGEMALINNAPRNATVTAKTDCGFYTVSRDNLQHQIEQLDPMMRGLFRVLILSVRDFLTNRDVWLKANEPQEPENVEYFPDPTRAIGGGLAAGEERKLQF